MILFFIYFNSKFNVTCKKHGLSMSVHQDSYQKRKHQKFNTTFAILPSYQKNFNGHPEYLESTAVILFKQSDMLYDALFYHKNTKSGVG